MLILDRLLELLTISFFIGTPVHVLSSVAQWVVQFRLIPNHHLTTFPALKCILYSVLTAYILAFLIWILWPLHPELILYNDRLSIPASLAQLFSIPFWLHRFGYFKKHNHYNH